jgi:hypothetical protein
MQKYIYLISLFLIILAAAITGLYYVVYAPPNTSPSAVILTLTNPSDVTSGDEVNFLVKYKNGTGASLSNANLFFHFPEGSVPAEKPDQLVSAMEIGAMKPGEEGSREFKAQVIGAKNSVLRAEAELTYNSAGVA